MSYVHKPITITVIVDKLAPYQLTLHTVHVHSPLILCKYCTRLVNDKGTYRRTGENLKQCNKLDVNVLKRPHNSLNSAKIYWDVYKNNIFLHVGR
jgi:hypothetical protein